MAVQIHLQTNNRYDCSKNYLWNDYKNFSKTGGIIMGLFDFLSDFVSSNTSPSSMSDSQLQRKLDRGVGKNTGESIASRASYIKEGMERGITANQTKKK